MNDPDHKVNAWQLEMAERNREISNGTFSFLIIKKYGAQI